MSQRPETDVLLDVEPGTARPASRPVEERSFHVALLGDFSGRGGRGSPEGLEPVAVDRDEVDAVLARFAPTVRVGGGGDGGVEVRFGSLEDFHPDALVESVPLFRSIREVAGGGSPRPRRTRPAPDAPAAPVEKILSGSVLDRIVDEQDDAGDDGGGGARDPLQGWVDDLVRPHLEGTPDPEEARLASKVEELVAEGMRELLHDRRFRRMEALWRGVDFLVRRVETGARLTLHLVDATAAGLAADPDLGAFREFLRRGHAGEPWSLVAALWEVDARPEELVLLRGMARQAAASGTVVLAGARPSLAGLPALSDAGDRASWGEADRLWTAFRGEPEASSVGMVLPRFLVRMPYGEETDPCEGLELEEIPGTPDRGDYVWGAAVLPVVVVLARAFSRAGPDLLDVVDPEVRELPLHVYQDGSEARATPCTEVALTRDDADRFLEAGIMPWAWSRGGDGLRLVGLRSAAYPPTALEGWWRR